MLAALALAAQIVNIDVIAADGRGRSVENLNAADFELRDDGTIRPVEGARLIKDDARLFAIYLDEYHVTAGAATARVREALARFIERDLGPADRIVVLKPLDSLFHIELTRDREAARAIVAGFEGRKGEYDARNDYERNFIAGTPARIEAARTQVAWSAINALAVHLGTLGDRRKTLIVVSEGLTRMERRRGQETLPSLEAVVRSATRSNVAIYPFDPNATPTPTLTPTLTPTPTPTLTLTPTPTPTPPLTPAPLEWLAGETDGQMIGADSEGGLRRAAADATTYYLLTYQVANPDDGKFHDLQVRVKRANVNVRARKGYFAPSPDDALRAAVLERINAPKPAAPPEPAPHASTLIRPWFGWSRGDSGRTRVTFVWEPAAGVPGDRVRRVASRLVLTALDKDGAVLFEGPVSPTGPGAIEELGNVPARAVFDAPAGRIRLRMTIQDAAAQAIDHDVRELSVRDLRGDVVIGTPQLLRARNAREFRALDEPAAVPVASREFSRTERLLVRVPIYAASDELPSVSARLLNRSGQAMRQLPVSAAAEPNRFDEIDLPLAGLAAGEYIVEVVAVTSRGQATDRIAFRVIS
jgi:VWFA-related protein